MLSQNGRADMYSQIEMKKITLSGNAENGWIFLEDKTYWEALPRTNTEQE